MNDLEFRVRVIVEEFGRNHDASVDEIEWVKDKIREAFREAENLQIEAQLIDLEAGLTRRGAGWYRRPPVHVRPADFPAHGPLSVGGHSKPTAVKD